MRGLAVWLTVVFLLLMAGVWYVGWQSRVDLHDSQLAGCERAKKDRSANALGWRTAQRRALSQGQPGYSRTYARIAAGQEQRARIVCSEAFPEPSLLSR